MPPSRLRVDPVQDALGLAKGIGEQHAGFALRSIAAPPLVDAFENLRLRCPAVDGQAEGRFGDEGMAAHRLESGAGAIRLDFVIPGSDPDLALILQPHLCRAQHMPGRVQAQLHTVMGDGFAIFQGLQIDVLTQTRAQNTFATGSRQIMLIAGAGMIAMRMGNDRALH